MKKRILSILLAFCLTLALMPMTALADESAAVQAGSASAKVGETIQIPVTLASNPGIAAALLEISYEENILQLKTITKGAVFSAGTFSSSTDRKNVQWYNVENNVDTTGVLFTLEFAVIGSGTATVAVRLADNEPTNFTDLDGVSVPVTFTAGTVNIAADSYTVTFDANGGTVIPATSTTDAAGKLAALPSPTRDGYTFDGWYTAANGGEKVDTNKVYTENTTLYAHWTENAAPEHVHNWAAAWTNNATHHWQECTAANCPVTDNSHKNGYGTHVYNNDADTTCNTCGYTRTVTPSHVHNWAATWTNNATHHWHECTAEGCPITSDSTKAGYGVHIYDSAADTTCNGCGYIRTVTPVEHTHRWSTVWAYNETHHWHECSAAGCPITNNSAKAEYGAHVYDDAKDTTCNICGYNINQTDASYIAISSSANGTITPSTRNAKPGERVSLYVYPDAGYKLDSITVRDIRGRTITLRSLGDNAYSFTMPNVRVTVDAVFAKIEANTPTSTPADNEPFTGLGTPGISGIVLNPAVMPFRDVKSTDWFYNSVDYVWKHYLMSGVSDAQFAPNTTTSRAMIWTILARMNNVRTDINPGNTWYEKGLLWAKEKGVTDGSDPMADITREQLATMLWRNAGSLSGTADLSQFSDGGDVSQYALTAVRWATANGILQGSDGKLNPRGTATRAQVAAMVQRYGEKVGS
ncbi:MAG: hypothetical protein HFF73_14300 [Oscillospiraceae bacterium]|nr:hypothetical protein [Oscillospiraceae bacterium]